MIFRLLSIFGGFESAIINTTKRITQFGSEVYKIFKAKICLNMNSKTDKETRSYNYIAFLSEIIANFRFWQVICNRNSVKFEADFEHMLNFAGV